ncbi:MAG: ribose 5-phosphate isomerase B [Actinobacteria bacterium]|nr:ribose 5-phosphate isomerase B [Actinomycetota bacterium]MBO0835241.1 ribose 5-phosphate isomerase B [Actinomycetota bacterium]
MRIAIGADHNGVAVKEQLRTWLSEKGHDVDDRGVHDPDEIVDYPPLCVDLCQRVLDRHADRAIIIGGAGGGEIIACNRLPGIRAALGQTADVARISRANNDTNVLVLGAKVLGIEIMQDILDVWLSTPFSGGRHQQRLDQIAALERGEPLSGRLPRGQR